MKMFRALTAAFGLCAVSTAWAAEPAVAINSRPFYAAAIALAYLAFCVFIARRHRNRQHGLEQSGPADYSKAPPTLIAFATQTGFAEQLAWRSAALLQAGGTAVRVLSLSKIEPELLRATSQALFIVSTTGEGDAPDHAARFARKIMNSELALGALRYGVLALGDRSFAKFCDFGNRLDHWLRSRNATPLFDRIEVDNSDQHALRHWQQQLSALGSAPANADWSAASDYGRWRLVERELLNQGSPGGPVFHIAVEPINHKPVWQAGDIAEVGLRNSSSRVKQFIEQLGANAEDSVMTHEGEQSLAGLCARSMLPQEPADFRALTGLSAQQLADVLKPLPQREYSIASLPSDERLELLIRQTRQADGQLGVGSGWLTAYAPMNAEIALRVRENRGFHPPEDDRPFILIGNGTGIAGLRAQLKAREQQRRHNNWLLFGERTRQHDYFYREEIEAWRANGILQRVDLAFSRDQADRVYVQRKLREAGAQLLAWVADGAAIYVCGSRKGMAAGVAATLHDLLGERRLEQLAEAGRYRRDVY